MAAAAAPSFVADVVKASEANSYASIKSMGMVAAATTSITSNARNVFSVAFKEGDWTEQERTVFALSLCIIILSAIVAGVEVVLLAVKPGEKTPGTPNLYHFGTKTKIGNAFASLAAFLVLALEALVAGLDQATGESGAAGNGTATAAP